jgi:hypothetical protein
MRLFGTTRHDAPEADHELKRDVVRNENGDVEAAPAVPVVEEIDPEIEKRVRRKLDMRIVPLLAGLYLLAFLDRSNIGYVLLVDLGIAS